MPAADPLFIMYTAAVLPFDFVADGEEPEQPSGKASVALALAGTLRAFEREPKERLVLLGLGSGELVRALDAELPPEVEIIVSELDTRAAREALIESDAPWNDPFGRTALLADTSVWAHFLLWQQSGLNADTAHLRLNPQCGGPGYSELRRLFASAQALPPGDAGSAPNLALAAILAPDDPGLDEFFAQIPEWITEAVVVWDGEAPPDSPPSAAVPVRHLARPLCDDFAAQRNALLEACQTDWVFSLDADERLTPAGWDCVRSLASAGNAEGVDSFFLPRRTLYPDEDTCMVGFGLWPDLQLRLFKRTPELRYERPVHERLAGLRGPFGVALNLPITHLNRLLKDAEAVRGKLAGFDRAGGGTVSHMLSKAYPSVPVKLLDAAESTNALRVVSLPFDPA